MAEDKITELIDIAKIQTQIDTLQKGLIESIALMEKLAGSMTKTGSEASLAKTNTDIAATMNKLRGEIDAANKSMQTKSTIEKQLATEEQKLKNIQKGLNDEIIAAKQAVASELATRKELVGVSNNQLSAYQRLENASKLASKAAKEMGAQLYELEKAGKKNTDEYNDLSLEFQQITKNAFDMKGALKQIDAGVNENQRNVGNYENSFVNVRAELRQVRNELANLMASGAKMDNPEVKKLAMRFDDLSDSMQKAKNASQMFEAADRFAGFAKTVGAVAAGFELATATSALFGKENEDLQKIMMKVQATIAMTQSLEVLSNAVKKEGIVVTYLQVAAQKALNIAMKANPIGLIITGITALSSAIYLIYKNTKDSTTAIDEFKTSISNISTEGIKAFNKSMEDSAQKAKDLKLEYDLTTGKITQAEYDLAKTRQKINVDYNKERYDINYKSALLEVKINRAAEEAKKAINKEAANTQVRGALAAQALAKETANKLNEVEQNRINSLKLLRKGQKKAITEINNNEILENQIANEKKLSSDEETNQKIIDENKAAYDKKIEDLKKYNEELKRLNDESVQYRIDTLADGLEKEMAIEGLRFQNAIDKLNETKDINKNYFEDLENLTTIHNKISEGITGKYKQEAANKQKEENDKNFATMQAYNKLVFEATVYSEKEATEFAKKQIQERIEYYEEGSDEQIAAKLELLALSKEADKKIKADEVKLEEDKERAKEEIIRSSASAIVDIWQNANNQRYEDDKHNLDKKYKEEDKKLKNKLDSGLITQSQYDRALADMQAKRDKEDLALRQKKAQEDKVMAIAKISIETAINIAKTPLMMPFLLALAAIQSAVVAATPIPKYAKGRKGGSAEFAIVGEAGTERIDLPSGQSYLTPNKPTLAYLPSGADVISNKELMKIGLDMPKIESTAQNIQNSIELTKVVNQLMAVENAIKNKKEVQYFGTEKGIKAIVKNGRNITEYIDKNVRI